MRRKRKKILSTDITFDKSELIDIELVDKASLWILRIILNLGGHREFIDNNNNFCKEDVVHFLDLTRYGEMDSAEYTRTEVLDTLKKQLAISEKQDTFSSAKILSKNMKQLSNLIALNSYEEQILEFTVLISQYEVLKNAVSFLGSELNSAQVKRILGLILDIPKSEVDAAFASGSKFSKSSLLMIDKRNTHTLDRKIEPISYKFFDNLMNLDENILEMMKESLKVSEAGSLLLKDYDHMQKDIEILLPYLEQAVATKQTGVNILFYGLPGTGKTELAKVLAQELGTKLFEVSYVDEDEDSIDGSKRLKAYKSAQAFLANEKTLLMYDEAEDIFESSFSFFGPPQRQKDKAWINRVLETNTIPTIWITNNINSIDNALVRRFDMSIELPIPPKSKREEIIKNYSNNLLDEKSIKLLAQNEDIAPALITRAIKVAGSVASEQQQEAFKQVLNNTLKAQGYKELSKTDTNVLSSIYNPEYINTNMNLHELAEGIKESANARICLYGVPGTGKSAFGKYVADILDRPLLLKKGSDLMSKYLGETEQNIARAFRKMQCSFLMKWTAFWAAEKTQKPLGR